MCCPNLADGAYCPKQTSSRISIGRSNRGGWCPTAYVGALRFLARFARAYRLGAALSLAFLFVGCATATRGTTQQVSVLTIPAGAACSVSNEKTEAPLQLTSPGSGVVARARGNLTVHCALNGFLSVTAEYVAEIGTPDAQVHRRQLLFAESQLEQQNSAARDTSREANDADRANTLADGAMAIIAGATEYTTAGMTFGAGAVSIPLLLAVVPLSYAVDSGSGALFGYPPVVLVVLPPEKFESETARDLWFQLLDDRFLMAAAKLAADTKKQCNFVNCSRRLAEDAAYVMHARTQLSAMKPRTRIENAPPATR